MIFENDIDADFIPMVVVKNHNSCDNTTGNHEHNTVEICT